ncbi:alpha/beta hydrolase [Breoghania sp.]|uniref:alpha/beta hydrolase n=1 Tax=Breoghania sp. TaxID=2065378 RepID=UPI002AA8FEF3|nr:alpha/beta hydrolase [Breoghania sp.]
MSFKILLETSGKNCLPYRFKGQPDREIFLNTYTSAGYKPGNEVVFVQHGMMRNGDDYRDFWIAAADKHDLLIVAPTFPSEGFPEQEGYNNGMILSLEDGSVTPRESWIFQVPGLIAGEMIAEGIIKEGCVRIFGHSAGGQFLHRMVSTFGFGPFKAVGPANAGWYSLATLEADFPAGLGGLGLDEDALRALFATDMHIFAGLGDCNADADNLPTNPEAIEQGPGRLQRAHNYFAKGKAMAEKLGCPFNWQMTEVPEIAHDGCAMSAAAAGLWFEGRVPAAEELGAGGFNA